MSQSPAVFTRIADPCGSVSRATATELVPNSTPVPSESVADGIFGSSGVGTGCTWTSSRQPGSRVQKARTLTIEFVVSPQANGGGVRTARDFASGRSNLQARANTTTADGREFGPVSPLSGVGDEAFSATSLGNDPDGRAFSSGATGIRFRNVLIEIRYGGGDHPADEGKPDTELARIPASQVRGAAESVAREVVKRLTDCFTCYNE